MEYTEVRFTCPAGEDWRRDLLINDLAAIGFDTFEDTEEGFNAYIASQGLDIASIEYILLRLPSQFPVGYTVHPITPKNWNQVWESNFEPILVSDRCYVRATFHQPRPNTEYEIIIDPKMAFGTGHHQTTALMMTYMLESDLRGKRILDMGCGTGILAILAAKLEASSITAIDNDQVCCDSMRENAELNQVKSIQIYCGSKEVIPAQEVYDLILANINRNILLEHLDKYAEVMKPKGLLLMSGFYDGKDLQLVKEKANALGLVYLDKKSKDNWVAARFKKMGN